MLADFNGGNTPIMTNFKLLKRGPWTRGWEELCAQKTIRWVKMTVLCVSGFILLKVLKGILQNKTFQAGKKGFQHTTGLSWEVRCFDSCQEDHAGCCMDLLESLKSHMPTPPLLQGQTYHFLAFPSYIPPSFSAKVP